MTGTLPAPRSTADTVLFNLVDLIEIITRSDPDMEKRGVDRTNAVLLSHDELRTLHQIFINDRSSVTFIARSLAEPVGKIRTIVRTLTQRGLIRPGPVPAPELDQISVVTEKFQRIRQEVRGQWSQYLRYSLVSLPAEHQLALEQASAAIRALSAALGHTQLDPEGAPL